MTVLAMNELLTIEALVYRTGLEESLIRFYESEYGQYCRNPFCAAMLCSPRVGGGCLAQGARAPWRHLERDSGAAPAAQSTRASRQGVIQAVPPRVGRVGGEPPGLQRWPSPASGSARCPGAGRRPGMANIHLLAGIQPAYTLKDLVQADLEPADLITRAGGHRHRGRWFRSRCLADSTAEQRQRFLTVWRPWTRHCRPRHRRHRRRHGGRGARFLMAPTRCSRADPGHHLPGRCLWPAEGPDVGDSLPGPVYSVVNMATTVKQAADVAVRFANCASSFWVPASIISAIFFEGRHGGGGHCPPVLPTWSSIPRPRSAVIPCRRRRPVVRKTTLPGKTRPSNVYQEYDSGENLCARTLATVPPPYPAPPLGRQLRSTARIGSRIFNRHPALPSGPASREAAVKLKIGNRGAERLYPAGRGVPAPARRRPPRWWLRSLEREALCRRSLPPSSRPWARAPCWGRILTASG